MVMNGVLNIPLSLIQGCAKKRLLKELACAILLKKAHTNSIIYNLTLKNIESVFHVSRATAVRLRKTLQGSSLFIYNAKNNSLFAKSFKSDNWRTYGSGKRSFKSNADYCLKFDIDTTELTPQKIAVILRDFLTARAIDSQRREESLKKHLSFLQCDEQGFTPQPTTLGMYAGIIGMSRSTAGRDINRLAREGKVSKTKIVAELVIPYYTAEKLRDYQLRHPHSYVFLVYSQKWHNHMCFVNRGRRYSLIDKSLADGCKNVIYRHPQRIKALAAKTVESVSSCCGMPDFFYDNIKKHRIL